MTSLQVVQDSALKELDQMQALCKKLMQTPHFAKMGEVGVFAVIQKAKSMGMNPLDALSGGMYFVQGKVEMSGQSMLALIRAKGHSVSMDPKSTETKVIMYGKRCDNSDTWRAEFSVEDAKRQGIYRNQWEKMPRIMCMWRCVSQLGRFLFSDILKGVYVEGEIGEAINVSVNPVPETDESFFFDRKPMVELITEEMAKELDQLLSKCSPDYQRVVNSFMKKNNIAQIRDLPIDTYSKIIDRAKVEYAEYISRNNQSKEGSDENKIIETSEIETKDE